MVNSEIPKSSRSPVVAQQRISLRVSPSENCFYCGEVFLSWKTLYINPPPSELK